MIEQLPLPYSGGSFVTSTRRAVWHTVEGGSIEGAIAAFKSQGFCSHFLWDSVWGRILQHLPLTVAATTLENHPGGVETNRDGAIQIEVVGFAIHPFTAGPCNGLDELMSIIRGQGVPDVWPMGPPLPYPASYGAGNGNRDPRVWDTQAGHYGHSQTPENAHGDPGAIDITRLFGTNPAPRPLELPDMFVAHKTNGHGIFVTDDGPVDVVDGTQYKNLRAAGVREADLSDEQIDRITAKASK